MIPMIIPLPFPPPSPSRSSNTSSESNEDYSDEDDYDEDSSDSDTDSDFSNLSAADFLGATIKNFPVQVICLEELEETLDTFLESSELSENEWISCLFQVSFELNVSEVILLGDVEF